MSQKGTSHPIQDHLDDHHNPQNPQNPHKYPRPSSPSHKLHILASLDPQNPSTLLLSRLIPRRLQVPRVFRASFVVRVSRSPTPSSPVGCRLDVPRPFYWPSSKRNIAEHARLLHLSALPAPYVRFVHLHALVLPFFVAVGSSRRGCHAQPSSARS